MTFIDRETECQTSTLVASQPTLLEMVTDETAAAPRDQRVEHAFATVVSASGGRYVLESARRVFSAARAASCVLEPGPGDRVLLATDREESFILDVLVRRPGPAQISVDGADLTIRSGGHLSLKASGTASIAACKGVEIAGPTLSVRALDTRIFSTALHVLGGFASVELEKIEIAARTLDSTIDRLRERLKSAYRTVEEIDQQRARQLDVVVEGNARIHADNTIVTAEKLVKMNAEQVHLA